MNSENRFENIWGLREWLGTKPSVDSRAETKFYRGVENIYVDLVDWPVNPYKAMFTIATATWGTTWTTNKWKTSSPEARLYVVQAILNKKCLPNAMEAPSFTFEIAGPSRSTFDQIARARIGVVFGCIYSKKHLVETSKGKKMLGDIQVGDLVLTHRGRFRPVTQIFKGKATERYTIYCRTYGSKMTVTPEHPFLVQKEGFQEWIKASDLKEGDSLVVLSGSRCEICGIPIPERRKDSQKIRNRFCGISCQRKWWMTTEEAADANGFYKKIQDPNRMTQPEKVVCGILKYLKKDFQYGYRIKTKTGFRFIDFAFPERKIAIEVHGFMNSRIPNKGRFDFGKNQIRVEELESEGWKVIEIFDDDLIKMDVLIPRLERELEVASLNQNEDHQFEFATVKIKKIIHKFGQLRAHYNLEVEEDNSYIASGLIVHNSMGLRDNDQSNIGIRIPEYIWRNEEFRQIYMQEALRTKEVYSNYIKTGQGNWQDARAILPMGITHRWTMAMNYMAMGGFMARRLMFSEQADTVATAWLMRERLREKFPLLASYLRPASDWARKCVEHVGDEMAQAFGNLFRCSGRWPCELADDKYSFNTACSDRETMIQQLGIYIPAGSEDLPNPNLSFQDLSITDQTYFSRD